MKGQEEALGSSTNSPSLLLQTTQEGLDSRWLLFSEPVEIHQAHTLAEVMPTLHRAAAATERGLYAAGFLSYESAPAFDPALSAHPHQGPCPIAWWGIFRQPEEVRLPPPTHPLPSIDWRPDLTPAEHAAAIAEIHRHIAAGDTYQVNFTFPLRARLGTSPYELFLALSAAQGAGFGAYVDLGKHIFCSASPELFFALDGQILTTRPMKGTAPRGRTLAEDARRVALLAASTKERAENVMIVDMMRNDLGRIALPGSVQVESLFDIETFPTVHQMTSTVTAKTQASLPEIFAALFPCASITGAPKIRTSEIIRRLEAGPRGVYTGTIGWLGPQRQARFNVAIRTLSLQLDSADPRSLAARPLTAQATYGTGGGIVWDSSAEEEYAECRTKALVLDPAAGDFELLETLLWRPGNGFFLLERHLERLQASATYFSFTIDRANIRQRLHTLAASFPPLHHRIRLLLSDRGVMKVQATPMLDQPRRRWRVALDDRPLQSSNVFLFHKTTQRQIYQQAIQRHPGFDDVLLWNEKKELTESTRANLALELAGQWYTPPIDCGLLAGTYRAELLARGRIEERVLPISALRQASRVRLFNSLRGWLGTEIERPQES